MHTALTCLIESANIFTNYKWQYELVHISNEHIDLAWVRHKSCVQQMKKKSLESLEKVKICLR